MTSTTTETAFATRRTRQGQVVAVGSVQALEDARRSGARISLTDPAGRRATARILALGRSFLPAGVAHEALAYGYITDIQIEEEL